MADFRLSGEFIAHIGRVLQEAILTGTDLSDHMRMIRVTMDNDTIVLTEEFKQQVRENEAKMLAEIEEWKRQQENSGDSN